MEILIIATNILLATALTLAAVKISKDYSK